jgi:glycosyltransferase involved in cell wall biosynthesis
MKKQSIVLASILKPVDDTRMFEKMAQSLAATNDWEVHVVGHPTRGTTPPSPVHIHPLGEFARISWARLRAPFAVFKIWLNVKPDVILVCTHELLVTAVVYKIFFGAKLIYDVQENYFLNVRFTNAFPTGIRQLIACEVRFREWFASSFIHTYLLAEKIYKSQLPFIGKKFVIIENKCRLPVHYKRQAVEHGMKLLFSGTLDESTGILQAIELSKKLHGHRADVTLVIIGHCALPPMRKKILDAVADSPFISIVGFDSRVAHSQIMEEIATATAGVIFYPPSRHNHGRVPTKLFEYAAGGLPILYDQGATWRDLIAGSAFGLAIDFEKPNCDLVLKGLEIKTRSSETNGDMTWQSEEAKFLTALCN